MKKGERYIIYFEGADFKTKVWLNGNMLTEHVGGYTRFSVDATDYLLRTENVLTVKCEDGFDTLQPRGKQRWLKESFGCWYLQTTGIWKPVWSEVVSSARLEGVKITPDIDKQAVNFEYELSEKGLEVETKISFDGTEIASSRTVAVNRHFKQSFDMRSAEFDFKVKLWSPETPFLYDVQLSVYKDGKLTDSVGSYFGMRKIEADKEGIRLNNVPLYQKLVLAQNYWKNSGLTMPDEAAALKDIEITKAAGFNGMRIHQKIEDERFLAMCDVEGLLVWAEYPAAYEYGFDSVKYLTDEWLAAVKQQYDHPCIITWVPFNESWGIPSVFTEEDQQRFTKAIYSLTKSIDTTRPVIVNDGWEHTCSDIITLHDYDATGEHMMPRYREDLKFILENKIAHGQFKFAFAQGNAYCGQPIIVSEYGGIALEGGDGWGYNGRVKDVEALLKKYEDLTVTIKNMPTVSGFCYTQLTDVYQEINGLVDMDRNPKIDLNLIKEINEK